MKVKCFCLVTATGTTEDHEIEVATLTQEDIEPALIKEFDRICREETGEPDTTKYLKFVFSPGNDREASFILDCDDPVYFGRFRVLGHCYVIAD